MIKDSGARTEFESGAVRDIKDEQGRCDLMPLDVIGQYYEGYDVDLYHVFHQLDEWKRLGQKMSLFRALAKFVYMEKTCIEDIILDVSVHFKEGAEKYGENNWQKGIPTHSYLDSAVRHLLKYSRGDEDERHDRAFVWNILCLIWTLDNKPELDDVCGDADE